MNRHRICVLDFETDGVNPYECNPVQLACLVLDGRTLKVIPDSEFSLYMQPQGIANLDEYLTPQIKDTVEWHAKNMGLKSEDILNTWSHALTQKDAWNIFVTYIKKYNPGGKVYSAPMMAGMNIREFDAIIIKRMMDKYGTAQLFWQRDKLDLLDLCFMWFENMDEPKRYNMETLRKFFGITSKGSHEALKDVRDTTQLLVKFMQLTRRFSSKVQFKGSCKE